ncbi:MAG TPA: HlyC/CorC family transporter [Alphaproteobacteria bacterium]|jgi:Mg2+/Co2+ transporter CorB|nr:HlyC/CorC family transporter [Alphaproteobacteria bacterium]
MDLPIPVTLIAIGVLILIAAFFSAAETALTAASRVAIHQLEREGVAKATVVKRLRARKEQFIAAILFGNNLVNILASALTTEIMVQYFPGAGVLYATAVLTVVLIVFGEVLPKTYAIQHANRVSLSVASPIEFFTKATGPIISAIQAVVGLTLRMFGQHATEQEKISATQALRGAIELSAAESGGVRRARAMLHSILELQTVTVGEIMVHRGNVVAINADLPSPDIVAALMEQPHTRVPLWRGKPENIVGVLHVKALLKSIGGNDELRHVDPLALMTPPWFVPESTKLFDQLQAFRDRHEHFALVVDEYGDLQGIVTLEDILEEIVGDISDEHDTATAGIRIRHDGTILAAGDVTLRDLNRRFDWRLPDDEASTIAGLILHEARQIPDVGQTFAFHGFRFEVLRRQQNRITAILIRPPKRG